MKGAAIMALLAAGALVLSGCIGITGTPAGAPPFAGQPASPDPMSLSDTIDVGTLRAVQSDPNVVVLDVREQAEYDAGHIPGVRLIPLGQVAARLNEIPKDKTVIVTCRTGNRSAEAARILREKGYTNIHNMAGGIVAWEKARYPVER